MRFASEQLTRRAVLSGFLAGGISFLTGCETDGNFTFLGYTSKPNTVDGVKTVYVPIFENKTFQTTPYRGMEFELTRAVIREVELKGYKVISDCNRADTELLGTLVTLTKNILNRTQQNEVRQGELILGVQLVWRDLRNGVILSNPPRNLGTPRPEDLPAFDPDNLPRPEAIEKPRPIMITMSGRYLPEVGETNASAQTRVCNSLAMQIANMMEKQWRLPPKPCPPLDAPVSPELPAPGPATPQLPPPVPVQP